MWIYTFVNKRRHIQLCYIPSLIKCHHVHPMIILETKLTTLLVLFLIWIFVTSIAAVEYRYGRMRHENGKVDRPYFRGRQNTWACNVYPYTSSVTLRLDNVWLFILDLYMVIYIAFKYNNAIFLSRRFVEKRVNIRQIIINLWKATILFAWLCHLVFSYSI